MPTETSPAPENRVDNGCDLLGLLRRHVPTDFDPREFLIVGSARLYVEGICSYISDLDVFARPHSPTWYRAIDLALDQGREFGIEPFRESVYTGDSMPQLYGGAIEVFHRWLPPELDFDSLLKGAEVFDGLNYLPLEGVLSYKCWLDREKDQQARAAIHAHRQRHGLACLTG